MRRAGRCAGFAALLLALVASGAQAQTFPKFTGLVVDAANVIPADEEAALTTRLEALQKETGRQLVVATVPDTQGYPLSDYGYRLGRAWGVGLFDVDNGAILFAAPGNPAGQRGPRIEVGRGLEPILTDAMSSVIINQQIMPRIREGQIAQGLVAGADAIAGQLRASPDEAKARTDAAAKQFDATHRRGASGSGGGFPLGGVFGLMLLGFIILSFARGRGGRGKRYRSSGGGGSGVLPVVLWSIANEMARGSGGGGWGGGGGSRGGGGSDGSWGGGGFTGGGGGDFGGGGASGDW